jgi:hypothetical protein
MSLLTPRGLDAEQRDWLISAGQTEAAIRAHAAERQLQREQMLAVTGRQPQRLVHDADVLLQHKASDWCSHCTPRQCYWPLCEEHKEMACTTGGAPTVPTRLARRHPRPSRFERLVDFLTKPRLALRERLANTWTWLRASVRT